MVGVIQTIAMIVMAAGVIFLLILAGVGLIGAIVGLYDAIFGEEDRLPKLILGLLLLAGGSMIVAAVGGFLLWG